MRYSSRSNRLWPAGIVAALATLTLTQAALAGPPYTADYYFWKKGGA